MQQEAYFAVLGGCAVAVGRGRARHAVREREGERSLAGLLERDRRARGGGIAARPVGLRVLRLAEQGVISLPDWMYWLR